MDRAAVKEARRRLWESYQAELAVIDTRIARAQRRKEELREELRQADKSKRATLLEEISSLDWYIEYCRNRKAERKENYHYEP